jgi:hypothetical protein
MLFAGTSSPSLQVVAWDLETGQVICTMSDKACSSLLHIFPYPGTELQYAYLKSRYP